MKYKKKKQFLLILGSILFVGSLLYSFLPKIVGSPLCGSLCPPLGPQIWEQDCFGYEFRETVTDSYLDKCIGFPYGAKSCYGYKNIQDNELELIDCQKIQT